VRGLATVQDRAAPPLIRPSVTFSPRAGRRRHLPPLWSTTGRFDEAVCPSCPPPPAPLGRDCRSAALRAARARPSPRLRGERVAPPEAGSGEGAIAIVQDGAAPPLIRPSSTFSPRAGRRRHLPPLWGTTGRFDEAVCPSCPPPPWAGTAVPQAYEPPESAPRSACGERVAPPEAGSGEGPLRRFRTERSRPSSALRAPSPRERGDGGIGGRCRARPAASVNAGAGRRDLPLRHEKPRRREPAGWVFVPPEAAATGLDQPRVLVARIMKLS
jgi:hypothetical protein